ncbi:uncharacterized protein LOC101239954 isoform X5 [Hydra vulgaris]|uniref:Uncharacterized protein LOC101239954 isoform X5 n=1 Tax=Hydra vulgaris TaxID=6087 RepID=A0ABM4D692_HYDVU
MTYFEAFKVDLENITKKYENASSIDESFNVSDLSDPENQYISNNYKYVEETESDEDSIDESSSSDDSLMIVVNNKWILNCQKIWLSITLWLPMKIKSCQMKKMRHP